MRAQSWIIVGACLLAAAGARADNITDQLDQAKKYYQDGDIAGAIGELEFVLQEIKGKVGQAYIATFPDAPSGWTAGEVTQEAGMPGLTGTMLTRTYSQANGSGKIEAKLMTGGGFMQGLAQMFMNPQMMAAQPNAKRLRLGKENAVVSFDPAAKSGQLMVDVAGKVSLMLEGSGLANADPMSAIAGKWDFKKVREIAGL